MFWRKRKGSDFSAEIRAHLENETARLREQGMSEEEARAAARQAFGNVMRAEETFYEGKRWVWWDHLKQDVRIGLRLLAKSPGFAAVAVLTLALGIGTNTAIFSVVNTVLLQPLPFREPGRLMDLWRFNPKENVTQDEMSYPDFLDLRNQNDVFTGMAAFREDRGILFSGHGEPERVHGVIASASLIGLLGVSPAFGRTFRAEEDRQGKGDVAILSHEFWQKHFRPDESVLDQGVTLDGKNYAVVGVMPAGFSFPISAEPVDVWLTIATDGAMAEGRGVAVYDVITRLKPGVSVAKATAESSTIFARVVAQFPKNHTEGWDVLGVMTMADLVQNSRDSLLVLFAAVGMVLLIACVNVANLILARGTSRRREIALRTALGASRLRVVRQLLTESLILALFGGGLGLAAAYWAMVSLIRIGPQDIPRLTNVKLDGTVFGFALGVSLLTSLLFGLAPALRLSKMELGDALKERVQGAGAGGERSRFRDSLIVAEVALSLLTVLGAGLLIQTLWHLEKTHPGFDPNHVLTFSVQEPHGFSDSQRVAFLNDVVTRVRALPGVDSTSAVFPLPFLTGVGITTRFEVGGKTLEPDQTPRADLAAVDDGYFRAMRIPVIKGQDFMEAKPGPGRPQAMISESFAKQYFPNEDPIGQRLKPDVETSHTPAQMAEIVGVVADVRTSSLREAGGPVVYVPVAQLPMGAMTIVMRSEGDARPLMAAVRSEVHAVNAGAMVFSGKTLEQQIGITLGQPRFNALLLVVFAGLALVLAMVGLYGAISYAVSRRTHEIGIRMALGAAPRYVMKLMLGNGLRLALIGTALGLAAAFGLARLMTRLLYGVSATDPLTFLGVATVLMVVAMVACYIPARRAMRVDPMVALRHE
ncbi:MAG TPA: ABC transporter permease [Candidatus Acidoferrum sp.]